MKKVLAFVLVLAMVLGSVSMAFAATTYTDDAAITNKEAVKVLSELKVLEGDSNGFRPNDTLTRAEAAAIAARLLLGRTDADKLPATATSFSDVPATHWAAGYIAYCASQGLLVGNGDGTFNPDGLLTVAAFTKMMLCALGYKADVEGLVGSDWEANTAALAVKAGISVKTTGACTRETAAQLGLNTLKADEVEYKQGSVTVNAGGVQVVVGGSAATKVEGKNKTAGTPGTYAPDTKDTAMQFMEDHFEKLTYTQGVGAKLGRPDGYQWKLANVVVATGNGSSNLVASFTTKVNQGTMYTTIGKDVIKAVENGDAAVTVIKNSGALVPAGTSGAGVMTANNIAKQDSTTAVNGSDVGVQTEVYIDKDNNVTIVEFEYFAVKANAKYDADDEKLTVKYNGGTYDIKAEDYAVIKDAAKGDWFIVVYDGAPSAANLISVEKANVVSGSIESAIWKESATVGGTKYSFAASMWDADNVGGLSAKSDIDLVLDKNGFVAAFANTETTKYYTYISEVASSGSLTSAGQKAGMYFIDGTYSENTVKNADSSSPAGLYSYTVGSDGKYKLTAVDTTGTLSTIKGKAVEFATASATIKADDNTAFVVIKNPTSSEAKIYTYKGYKSLPSISGVANKVFYVVESGKTFASTVFIVQDPAGAISTASSDYLFVYGIATKSAVSTEIDGTYYTMANVLVNGDKQTVSMDAAAMGQMAATENTMYINPQYDNNGLLTGAENISGKFVQLATDVASDAGIAQSGSVLSITTASINASLKLADDVKIIVIDGTTVKDTTADNIGSLVKKFDKTTGVINIIYDNTTDQNVKTLIICED